MPVCFLDYSRIAIVWSVMRHRTASVRLERGKALRPDLCLIVFPSDVLPFSCSISYECARARSFD